MKKSFMIILKTVAIIYIVLCIVLYFIQEKLIFFPEKLAAGHKFEFSQPFEEMHFKTADNKSLHGILFKAPNSKGLIFYLHGNAGALNSWGEIATAYTGMNYDLFMLDYRGYGKSEGTINSEKQIYDDVQLVYDNLKMKYNEANIIILGYSIGSGPAAKLASRNNAKRLILQAPYYNLSDMMKHAYPILPTFLLKYKFETNKFIKDCKMPVTIFHGDKDEVIYYGSSMKLKTLFKSSDTLITLKGLGHNGMSYDATYIFELQKILNQ